MWNGGEVIIIVIGVVEIEVVGNNDVVIVGS